MQRLDILNQVLFWILLVRSSAATPSTCGLFGSRGESKERIPLNATISNNTGNKVSLRSDVYLVARLVVIGCLDDGFSREDCVSRIVTSLSLFPIGTGLFDFTLTIHLATNG